MSDELESLLKRRKGQGLLVDTNILLLYFVGSCDPRLVTSFKRTRQFTLEDFDLLVSLVQWFGSVVTTPNILTEVNSLASQLAHDQRRNWRTSFRDQFSSMNERVIASEFAVASNDFIELGLTDCGILELSKDGLLVLTDDLALYLALQCRGIDSINFNHLRTLNG